MPNTTNFNWATPADTDLVKDGAAAIRTLGNSIDSSFVDLKGGTTGQLLSKASNTDLDFTWAAAGMSNPMTTTADIIYSSSGSTPARLGIGTAGQVLAVNSGATAPEWKTLPASGKVLQVVQMTTSTLTSIATGTYTDSGLTLAITPSSATSKVLVIADCNTQQSRAGTSLNGYARIVRTSTTIYDTHIFEMTVDGATGTISTASHNTLVYLDSPSTTSATTYKVQGSASTGATLRFQYTSAASSLTLIEIGA